MEAVKDGLFTKGLFRYILYKCDCGTCLDLEGLFSVRTGMSISGDIAKTITNRIFRY